MGDGLLGVACFVGEYEGCRECGDTDTELQQSVAVSREGIGVGGSAVVNDEGTG